MSKNVSLLPLTSVAWKQLLHILRDPLTLIVVLCIPIFETFMLGFAINTNVRHIPTVIFDQCRSQESRRLIQRLLATGTFEVVCEVLLEQEMHDVMLNGQARVAIKIPHNYSHQLLAGQPSQVLVLVDGSDSTMASEAVNVSNAIISLESVDLLLGRRPPLIEARQQVLFNPDTRSANFFLPGLMILHIHAIGAGLAAMAIVREKENGTLERLFISPLRSFEVILGKLAPYVFLTFLILAFEVFLMRVVFGVVMHGSFLTLVGLAFPYILTTLGVGLLVSMQASTLESAQQMTLGLLLPSIFLSGYLFPIQSMPPFFGYVARLIPVTWMIECSRGVILRGAGWTELWLHGLVLWFMAAVTIFISILQFRRRFG